MINLTDEMVSRLDSALADGYSCLVGTASKDGEPQDKPKGSVMAFNRDTLAIGSGPSGRPWTTLPRIRRSSSTTPTPPTG